MSALSKWQAAVAAVATKMSQQSPQALHKQPASCNFMSVSICICTHGCMYDLHVCVPVVILVASVFDRCGTIKSASSIFGYLLRLTSTLERAAFFVSGACSC